ncbi:hypothetical protein ONS96_002839 [Cadophora gregata f. sp. sojae]|nr:hypothetical protein ONS96_002839 [Cadophora gregata f. sp. sojae]
MFNGTGFLAGTGSMGSKYQRQPGTFEERAYPRIVSPPNPDTRLLRMVNAKTHREPFRSQNNPPLGAIDLADTGMGLLPGTSVHLVDSNHSCSLAGVVELSL